MQERFSTFDDMQVSEVGDGNLNYVYLVSNRLQPLETVVLKQAVPYLRVVGESWPLTRFKTDDSLCPIHRTRFQTIARSVLSTHGNFRKLLEFISRREQRRLWQGKLFGH
jgi:hypothetical protein